MELVTLNNFTEGERAIITSFKAGKVFENFLLANGITLGTVVVKNYSPQYAKLINLTVNGKLLTLRNSDFEKIECFKI